MTSKKIKVDGASSNIKFDSLYDSYVEENINKNRNLIALSIEVSKLSKVPMMILGNPGEGKTTTIDDFARQYGYHVEKLIGSQYSQDDILGFQTNTGKEHLEVLIPNWYQNIMDYEAKGIPSILFLDELVTASTEVQEALLQLTKERTIRDNRKLPDDTVVMSAINYKENLPPENNLTATQLNRFCLLNTLPGTPDESLGAMNAQFVAECMQGFSTEEFDSKLPSFKSVPFSDKENIDFRKRFGKVFESILNKYSEISDSDKGYIDLRNTRFDGMFEGRSTVPEVYNFISKRTVSYLLNIMRALCELGIRSNSEYWKPFIVGLIGLGSNTWSDDDKIYAKQISKYHQTLFENLGGLLDTFSHSDGSDVFEDVKPESKETIEKFDTSKLSGKIKKTLSEAASGKLDKDAKINSLTEILKEINNEFPTTDDKFIKSITNKTKSMEDSVDFRANFESVEFLKEGLGFFIYGDGSENIKPIYEQTLDELLDKYKFYYTTCQNGIKEENL